MSWRPLLEGSLRDEALTTARAILDELPPPGEGPDRGPSLADGDAGFALVNAYAGRALDDAEATGHARRFLERAIGAATRDGISLFAGVVGVGWAASHMRELIEEDVAASLESSLIGRLQEPWNRDYDLVAGLVGFGVFALERLPSPSAEDLLRLVVGQLEERALRMPEGVTWESSSDWVPASVRDQYPDRLMNLGLAHGVPGPIGLMAAARAVGIGSADILEDAVRWLRAQRFDTHRPSCFPRWVAPAEPPDPGRTAWCYGDPGISAALLLAARALGSDELEAESVEIANEVAVRDPADGRVEDAGFCHGAAGVAHILGRAAIATEDPRLLHGAVRWATFVLGLRDPGGGIGGYRFLVPDGTGELRPAEDASLLTGAAGVALVLVGLATGLAPDWDRFLLASASSIDLAAPRLAEA